MPHPRCNRVCVLFILFLHTRLQLFRDQYCTENYGSSDCYMSSQNIHTSVKGERCVCVCVCVIKNINLYSTSTTNHGQVCCYNERGALMFTNYSPILQIPTGDYMPGFPTRAYEFGTNPYNGQYQVCVCVCVWNIKQQQHPGAGSVILLPRHNALLSLLSLFNTQMSNVLLASTNKQLSGVSPT
jgi:hypothetical protein